MQNAVRRISLSAYLERIGQYMYPDPCTKEEISIKKAQDVISEYGKATNDPAGSLDLMIFFVECSTKYTLDFGNLWEEFYDSLESMYKRSVKTLKKMDEDAIKKFLPRLEDLVHATRGMWAIMTRSMIYFIVSSRI